MKAIVSAEHMTNAGQINQWLATYADVELLIKVGEYKKGSDPLADVAVAKYKAINDFLRQRTNEFDNFQTTLDKLKALVR